MWCTVKRGDKEGLIKVKGELKRFKTYRIRIVYRWMGYSWNRKISKEE